MFREAWRLQREHFWVEDMAGLDWDAIYERYLPLVDRVATRSELSDLLWEVQGELGTSHAYEIGGEYRPGPDYTPGLPGRGLGAGRRQRALHGSPGSSRATPGTRAPPRRSTDRASTSRRATRCWRSTASPSAARVTPGEWLVNQADQEVLLTIQRGDDERRAR